MVSEPERSKGKTRLTIKQKGKMILKPEHQSSSPKIIESLAPEGYTKYQTLRELQSKILLAVARREYDKLVYLRALRTNLENLIIKDVIDAGDKN